MERPSPRKLKPRPSRWSKAQSSEYYEIDDKIEEKIRARLGSGAAPMRPSLPPVSIARHSRVSNSRDLPDDMFGEKLMTKGVHHFVLSFVLTHSSSAFGIILGVASKDGRRKFGVRCWDGRAISLPQPPKAPIGPLLVGCCMCIFCWRAKHGVADPAPARGYGTLWGMPVPLGGWTSGPSYEEVLQKDYDPRFVYNKRV